MTEFSCTTQELQDLTSEQLNAEALSELLSDLAEQALQRAAEANTEAAEASQALEDWYSQCLIEEESNLSSSLFIDDELQVSKMAAIDLINQYGYEKASFIIDFTKKKELKKRKIAKKDK